MSATFSLNGAKEMIQALEGLPEQLRNQELGPIVVATAEGLAGELKSVYPKRTGVLADRVTVEKKDALRAKVRNRAPHAHLYELGSVQRFTNQTGANRGTMPAKPTFIPAAVRWRARMIRATKDAMNRLRIPGFSGSLGMRES